jgi:hypothetical protein
MAQQGSNDTSGGGVDYRTYFEKGHLHGIDSLAHGDDRIGNAIKTYSDTLNANRQSLHWQRAVRWIENVFFSTGRQYVDDILVSRLANSSDTSVGNLSVVQESSRNIPKPTNDLLGRYIETNIALLTENRPRPRVSAKSDKDEDKTAAELSELTLEYLWEALKMPEKHRELARLVLHTGLAFMEVTWDPTHPRRIMVPKMKEETGVNFTPDAPMAPELVERQVPVLDEAGNPVMEEDIEYGDIIANIVSPFAFHTPAVHWWNGDDMGWVLKEEFYPIDSLKDKYLAPPKEKSGLTKKNGWNLEILKKIKEESVTSLAMWWWERISELVEGPGPSIYIGSPDYWEGYTIVRTFDRKPSPMWPKGRTIITVGDQVLYDSPKKRGARAYDPRWPEKWHPYIRFRWEPQVGSIYGRSLVSKLLPKLKRVNAIDTTMIMWRRTVPIATWTAPKGSAVVEDIWTGRPGMIWEFDPRRTATHKPEPVYPPPYPANALEERQQQIAEMESIAGTEQILRGERPPGVNSAAMIDILRKQALASRSAILQAWDESLQEEGTAMLQTVIRYVRNDPRYAERIRILSRERDYSRASIEQFSGEDLSDNVIVRVDTASMALVSKEARQARMVEVLQYLPNLMAIDDIGLRQAMLDELDLKKALMPSGPDVSRAKKMISLIRNARIDQVSILQEDDPHIFHAMLVNEMKSDGFIDLPPDQQAAFVQLIDLYERQIKLREMAQQQQMVAQMEMQAMLQGGGQGGGGEQ